MATLKLSDKMVTVYTDGRSDTQKDYARNTFEEIADAILDIEEDTGYAAHYARQTLGEQVFTPVERLVLESISKELHTMRERINALRAQLDNA